MSHYLFVYRYCCTTQQKFQDWMNVSSDYLITKSFFCPWSQIWWQPVNVCAVICPAPDSAIFLQNGNLPTLKCTHNVTVKLNVSPITHWKSASVLLFICQVNICLYILACVLVISNASFSSRDQIIVSPGLSIQVMNLQMIFQDVSSVFICKRTFAW